MQRSVRFRAVSAHPWRDLREMTDVRVHFVTMPRGLRGATDGVRHVWVDRDLLQRERRCVIAHELEHLRRGDTCGQDEKVETAIRRKVARDLIPWPRLADALRWAQNLHELAEELWVDEQTVRVRLESLHPTEVGRTIMIMEGRA